jgi:hypothetical protein
MMARLRPPTFVQFRTAVLFLGGLAGVAYETLVNQSDRPTLLIMFGAMMGLPLFLKSDEKHPPPVIELQERPAPAASPPTSESEAAT